MSPESGLIELCGGRFDGYRKPLRYVPLYDRLELRMSPSSLAAPWAPSRVAVYERRTSRLIRLSDLPTLVYRYEFTGINVRTPTSASRGLFGWMARFWRGTRRCFCRTGAQGYRGGLLNFPSMTERGWQSCGKDCGD